MSKKSKRAQPMVFTPTLQISQPDGSILLRAGKPVVLDETINTAEAARILGMSQRWIACQCDSGAFATAYKPGGGECSRWRLSREEVLARRRAASR